MPTNTTSPLVFGQPVGRRLRAKKSVEPEQSLTMELPDAVTTSRLACNPNPCVRQLGLGPEDVTCKTCAHLIRKSYNKTYLKCAFRRNSSSAATDHRAGWDACAKYQAEQPQTDAAKTTPATPLVETDEDDNSSPWWVR